MAGPARMPFGMILIQSSPPKMCTRPTKLHGPQVLYLIALIQAHQNSRQIYARVLLHGFSGFFM